MAVIVTHTNKHQSGGDVEKRRHTKLESNVTLTTSVTKVTQFHNMADR